MNEESRYARRYHWLGESVEDFVCEPHAAICTETRGDALNLVAKESTEARKTIRDIVITEKPEELLAELKKVATLELPARHHITGSDINPDRISKTLLAAYDRQPEDFETLLGMQGVGPKTLRALSLISELVYNVPVSLRDPARYSFAHGGKDGIPYPVDRQTYDRSIQMLHDSLNAAKLGSSEKMSAFKRLREWEG